jgi:hydrogenase maturation protease
MIRIVAIGNSLLSDDGIALSTLKRLSDRIALFFPDTDIVIGETDFVYCFNAIQEHDFVMIIDSTLFGFREGMVTMFSLDSLKNDLGSPPTQHHIRFTDILFCKKGVTGYVIGIEIKQADFGMELSESLKECFEHICNEVERKIALAYHMVRSTPHA